MNEELRNRLIADQYTLPKRLFYYAKRYPRVTFKQAIELYELAVRETILIHNVENLYSEPLTFGRGLTDASKRWVSMMDNAEYVAYKKEEREL